MALFTKKTEEEKAAASARADLAAAEKKLATVLSREGAAASSADRWAQWTAERDAAEAEARRLTKLVDGRNAAVQEAAQAAAEAEKLRQIETCRSAVSAFALRFGPEAAGAISTLITLARDDAALAIEAQRLNAILPPGVEPIAIAGIQARELPRLPRKDVATKELSLWVNSSTGGLIGNQDDVTDNKDGTGFIEIGRSQRIACVKRCYASTEYHAAMVFDHPGYFFTSLRLPFPNQPGTIFDGSRMTLQQVAAIDVALPPAPKLFHLSPRTELTPVSPWPVAGAGTEADRAVAE